MRNDNRNGASINHMISQNNNGGLNEPEEFNINQGVTPHSMTGDGLIPAINPTKSVKQKGYDDGKKVFEYSNQRELKPLNQEFSRANIDNSIEINADLAS